MKTPENLYDTSQYEEDLWFHDAPANSTRYFQHTMGSYALEGRILFNEAGDTPWVLSIHGARADYTKSDAVSLALQERGYSLLGMNLSGHSKAGALEPEQTTLGNNIREAEAFYEYLDDARQKVVFAYSLGGTPALKLLENHADEIDKLVLFYPGIYSKDSYNAHFGAEFRDSISQPFSYRNNDTIPLLRQFKGKMLLVVGQYDGLDPEMYGQPAGRSAGEVTVHGQKYYSPIPKEVIDLVYDAVPEERRQRITVPDCGHSVVLWMRDHPSEAEQLLDSIDTFLKR